MNAHPARRESRFAIAILTALALILYGLSDKARTFTFSDAEGYYMYLPALTMYGFDKIPLKTKEQFSIVEITGRYYDKYPAGVALLQLPFYLAALGFTAIVQHEPVDGYSPPFQHAVLLASLFYVMCGLYLLYRYFRKYYAIPIVVLGLACIFFGTNLLYYTFKEPGTAHAYSFFIWTVLLVIAPRIYQSPSWKYFILTGLTIGLLTWIRPTNILGVLLILGWDMTSLKTRWSFIRKHLLKYAFLPLPFIVFSIIQLGLWRHMAGESIFFSYSAEPGFIYWKSPKILQVLFHVHNGLFLYAPVLLVAVGGLIYGVYQKQKNFILILLILSLATYAFGSWWVWWFGGAYGHRCYVDYLPLFLMPLLYSLHTAYQCPKRIWAWSLTLMCIFCIYYSIGMTHAYHYPWEGPNFGWPEYRAIVKRVVFRGLLP